MLFENKMCTVQLVTADYFFFCERCADNNIPLFSVETLDSLTYAFRIQKKDLKRIKEICLHQGCSLQAIEKRNLLETAVRRPLLFGGIAFLFVLFLFLPTRILFVRVSGNSTVPSQMILEAVEDSGVHFMVSRRNLRSEAVKNALLQKIPELSWAGVNTRGCIAEILVKEHQKSDKMQVSTDFSNIVAARDGIIKSITIRSGIVKCQKGQAVQKGQELISGIVSTENRIAFSQPKGDVYAITSHILKTITPDSCLRKDELSKKNRIFTLLLGKKRIKLYGDSRNQSAVCGRIYKKYCITLPGGFELPAALEIDTYKEHSLSFFPKNEKTVKAVLQSYADRILGRNMIAGKILERSEFFSKEKDCYMLCGRYLCSEMIGRPGQKRIGEKQDTWNES